jgi:hypothetical protein
MQDQNIFEGWAKVEVMGHRTHFGYVTTVYFGTAGFFRVDIPTLPEEEEITQSHRRDENGDLVPAGSKIRRPEIAGGSPLVACSSIYQMTPCTEAAAIEAIRRSVPRPFTVVDLAKPPQITASFEIERCEDCGKTEANCECPIDDIDTDDYASPSDFVALENERSEHREAYQHDTLAQAIVRDALTPVDGPTVKFYSPTEEL